MPTARKVTIDVESWKRNLRDADPTDDDACTRWFNNYFAFWVICETKICKRAKRCAGDAEACHDRMWPHVPERMKFELRATLEAKKSGLSAEEVRCRVKEELTRFDETTRVLESLGASNAGAKSSSPLLAKGRSRPSSTGYAREGNASVGREPRGPRVRML
jgi:hypothetical protein